MTDLSKEKPFKGTLVNWTIRKFAKANHEHLGYYITGVFVDHPVFRGRYGHTSMVVKESLLDDGTIEIETLNSRYHLKDWEDVLNEQVRENS